MTTNDQRRDWLNKLLHAKAGGDKGRLADMVKMNRSSVSLLLSGKRGISEKMVYRIANRLKVDPPHGMDVLVEKGNEPQRPAMEAELLAEIRANSKAIQELQGLVVRLTTAVLKITEDR